MKKHWKSPAALCLCAALLAPSAHAAEGRYADVPPDAWYAEAVDYCVETGLMSGYGGGRFGPQNTLTRSHLAQILYNQAGRPDAAGDGFADVPADAWCAQAAVWAAAEGVLSGYAGGGFRPDGPVTRQQLAAALWRLAGEPDPLRKSNFTDGGTIAAYARTAVDWAASSGVMNGLADGSFCPNDAVTRAQMAAVLLRYKGSADGGLSSVSAMDVMCAPSGIAAMSDGTILVTDTYHKRLWRVREGVGEVYAGGATSAGLYGEPVGGYNDGETLASYFKRPWAVAEFLGGWAVSDTENNAIRIVRSRDVQTLNGKTTENLTVTGMGVAFDRPTGLAADGDGNLYVADTGNGAIRKITPNGWVSTLARGLDEPMGLCWKDGVLYIAEAGANRISKLENGKFTVIAGSGRDGSADGSVFQADFSGPQGVAVGDDGAIYVADTLNSAVRRIFGGRVSTVTVRDTALADFGLVSPSGLLLRGERLYICDGFARKVFVLELK